MADWLKQNGWAIMIAGVTVVGLASTFGARLAAVEAQAADNQAGLIKLTDSVTKQFAKVTDSNTQIQVSLAKISTDVEYLKVNLVK